MTEEVLIKVELPSVDENDKKIEQLTEDIIALTDANNALKKSNEELLKSGQKNSQEYIQNAKQIEINKQKINENTASRKGLIQVMNAEEGSIKALRVQNAELIKQRDLINTKTKEGQAAIQRINVQLDANNKVIRENSSNLEKQKINIGNYASALDNVIPGLGGFATGLTNLVNPLTAAAAGVGALVSLYSQSTIGTKDLEFASNQLSATINVLGNRFASLFSSAEDGEGILSKLSYSLLFQFDAESAALGRLSALNKEQLEDLNRASKQALIEQQNLLEDNAEILEKLADSQVSYNDKVYESNRAIDNIRNGAAAVRKIREEELSVLQQQLAIDKENEALQEAVIDKKLQIAQESRKEEKLVNNILKLQSNLKDTEDKRIQSIITQNIKLQEQAKIQEDALLKRLNNPIKIPEFENTNLEVDALDKKTSAQMNLQVSTDALASAKEREKKADEEAAKASKDATEADNKRTKSLLILSNAVGGASTIFKEYTVAHKVLSAAQAAINSFLAGTAVLADPALIGRPFLRIPLMITTIAAGLAQQVKILGSFAKGGILRFADGGIANTGGVLRGPSHAQGGIPFSVGGRLGFEAEGGEAIINKRSTAMFRRQLSEINKAGGGVEFALGGIPANETRIATQLAQSQFDARQIANLMNMVQVVLVREDYEVKQMEHTQTIKRATVIP